MAEGHSCISWVTEHDGNFYRFCKYWCHDKIVREIVDHVVNS